MLTPDGCRDRRRRFLDRMRAAHHGPLWLADPLHLRYLAGLYVDPFSLGADFGALLLLRPDGHATLLHDDRLPGSAALAHVDERVVIPWYAGQAPGRGPRRLVLREAAERTGVALDRIADALTEPLAGTVFAVLAELRRRKDADELAVLRACARAQEAGFRWAAANLRAGLSELDVYLGVSAACCRAAGAAAVVYGDFAVSPGPSRKGGPPTDRVLADGDLFILDFSVVLSGYRTDFTTTLAVGGRPTPEQRRLFELCRAAMAAGERELRAGAACLAVYGAVRDVFAAAGLADAFPHHAGHGLGVSHPEPPYIVREANETLVAGDVVTLEPGLYVDGIGGMRIEHNYHVTADGFERLSDHEIAWG
jgi:Xaa-Pro dipeptidase